MTYLLGMLKVQTLFFQYKGAEIKVKKYGTTDFKTLRLSNIQTFYPTLFYSAYISAPKYRTEKFLFLVKLAFIMLSHKAIVYVTWFNLLYVGIEVVW